jgi:hypothetical protein
MTWIDFSPSQRNTLKYYDVEFCLSLQIYQFYINSPMTKDISFLYRVQSGVSLPTSSRDVKILTLTVWLLMLWNWSLMLCVVANEILPLYYNIMISNKRNSSLSSSSRRSPGNLPLSNRCNMYNNLCNKRRSPDNLHCRRGTKPGNLCLKMRFVIVLLGQNKNDQNTSLVHLCCQKQT